MEQRAGKYLTKLYKSNDSEEYNFYLNKLKKMSKYCVQSGGSQTLDSNIATNVTNIVKGNYSLATDLNLIKNIKYKLEHCTDDFFVFSEEDSIKYKSGYKFNCFVRDYGVTTLNEKKDKIYNFKKNFSLLFTDIFMQKTLSNEDLIATTNYFCYTIMYTVDVLIENLIRIQKFGQKTDRLLGNVYTLYKGGNTTRLIYRCFRNSVINAMGNKAGEQIDKAKEELNDLVNKYNIGDWDFSIKINFDKLKTDYGFNDDELNTLIKFLLQSLFYTATFIKNKLSLLLKSNNSINSTVNEIQKLIFNSDTAESIKKLVETYNSITLSTKRIKSMKIDKVYIFDKIVEQNQVTTMDINDHIGLHKNSFIFKNTGKVETYKDQKVIVGNYVEINKAFGDSKIQSYIPESLVSDSVYVAYLSNMLFNRRYAISSFNLIRIKVNNKMEFGIVDNLDVHATKSMNVNMELVDLVVSNIYDCKGLFHSHYYYDNHQKFIKYEVTRNMYKNNVKIKIDIPSPYTMFADICHMLFIENQFIWEDPKYEKRIKRLFFLSLPCMFADEMKTKDIIHVYKIIHELFENLSKLHDISARLAFFNGHYEIIISPYNDNIIEKIKNNTTSKFTALNINHLIVQIKSDSKYKHVKYLEFLIANYIRMMIISNYIINNTVATENQELVRYELQIHRILEVSDVYNYIAPGMAAFTPSLHSLYKEIRGVDHSLTGTDLVPLGPLPNLSPAVKGVIDRFMNDDKLGVKIYERTIINNSNIILTVLNGMLSAHVNTVTTKYAGESFF
jgi:hypothetical protein